MGREKDNKKQLDKSMREILLGKSVPKSAYFLIILLYGVVSVLLVRSVGATGVLRIFGIPVPKQAFTGVYSSLGNMCIIFLVILFHKTGYVTAMIIMVGQFFVLLVKILSFNTGSNVPGLFMNILTIIAITSIFINNRRSEKYQKSIQEQALIDSLTGLPNRFAADKYIQNISRRSDQFAIVSVNLSNFKNVNDTMGHETGDKMLIEIAGRWKKLALSGDTGTEDFVARLLGDEFSIVIRDYNSEEAILSTIEAYKAELERKMTIDNCDYYMSACFGYAIYPYDDVKGNSALEIADAAMQEAKRVSDTETLIRFKEDYLISEKTIEIERKIRNALDEDKMFYYLQPQYDIDQKLRGFEALARMKDEDGAFISPGDFIPVAEKAGLIDQVDIRIFNGAVEFLDRMMHEKNADFIISVNVSVRHLMKNNFIDELKEALARYRVPADHIEIEITESIMIDSVEKALHRINQIKEMGMMVAIDDFGTGYSSLSYLNNFPADLLKIDKSFIDVMNDSESSTQYVATIISIGHILNLKVISEGVESEDQIETLKKNGCDFIQGYIWGKPLPAEEAERLVESVG